MAPFGAAAGAALVAGILACLCLPELPPWPVLAVAFALGLRGWIAGRRWGRLAGIALLGLGLCGLHAARTLERQLPPEFERADVEVAGTVVDLPRHEPDRTAFRLRVASAAPNPPHLRGRLLQLSWYDERGAGPDPEYPAPWAASAEASFLASPEATRRGLEAAGFEVVSLKDTLAAALEYGARSRAMAERGEKPPHRAVQLIHGEGAKAMMANTGRALKDGGIVPIELLARRSG